MCNKSAVYKGIHIFTHHKQKYCFVAHGWLRREGNMKAVGGCVGATDQLTASEGMSWDGTIFVITTKT